GGPESLPGSRHEVIPLLGGDGADLFGECKKEGPAARQVGQDARRARVPPGRNLGAPALDLFPDLLLDVIVETSQPLEVSGQGLGVDTSTGFLLIGAQARDIQDLLGDVDVKAPRGTRLAPRPVLAGAHGEAAGRPVGAHATIRPATLASTVIPLGAE